MSTDPAHSLSDAFLRDFTNVPTSPGGVDNLHVMEVEPAETMRAEHERWAALAREISEASSSGSGGGGDDGDGDGGEGDDMVRKIGQFQEWLSGIPGIDEATALASAIEHIESDRYDLIVCCRPGSRSARGGNPPFGDTGTCSRGWDRPRP